MRRSGRTLTKGTLSRIENGVVASTFVLHFNPPNIDRRRVAHWVDMDAPGTAGALAQFVRVENQTIDLMLYLAASRSGVNADFLGVNAEIAELESLMLPSLDQFLENSTHYVPPPTIMFSYGPRTWTCTVREFSAKETEHSIRLYPTQATVNLKLRTHSSSFEALRAEMAHYAIDRINPDTAFEAFKQNQIPAEDDFLDGLFD